MRIRTRANALAITALLSTTMVGVDPGLAVASSGNTSGCTPSWKVAAIPPVHQDGISVSALSAHDAWFTGLDSNTLERPVWHWDGKTVDQAAAQIPAGPFFVHNFSHLTASVSSFSSDTEGWVMLGQESTDLNVAERWHGGRWTRVSLAISPDPRNISLHVNTINSVTATDAWAFGNTTSHEGEVGALIEHWDGVRWNIVPHPASAMGVARLGTAEVISATDIWAQGILWDATTKVLTPLVEHWDGTRWSITPTPALGGRVEPHAISASSPDDVWMVGARTMPGTENLAAALVEHWNGTAWSVVTDLPDVGNSNIESVYASGPNNVWATLQLPGGGVTSFLHWDGVAWTTVPSPTPTGYFMNYTYPAMGGTGADDVWAFGTALVATGAAGAGLLTGTVTGQILHLSCGKD